MSLFSIDTFYFLSLGIIGLLIVLLIFHFRNKIVFLEKQVQGLHGIATELVNDVKRANAFSTRVSTRGSDSLENMVLKKGGLASGYDIFDFSKQPILEEGDEDDEDYEDDEDDEELEYDPHAPPIVIGSVIESSDLNVQEVVSPPEETNIPLSEEGPTGGVMEEVEIVEEIEIVEEVEIVENVEEVNTKEDEKVVEENCVIHVVEEDDNMTVATTDSISKWPVAKLRHFAHSERGIEGVAKMKKAELLVLLKE